jgi:hypothetical protein
MPQIGRLDLGQERRFRADPHDLKIQAEGFNTFVVIGHRQEAG